MKSIFERMGGAHRQVGDYLLPEVEAPESPKIGIWGQRRLHFLREHRQPLYTAMLLSAELNAHLESIDRDAEQMFDRLVRQYAAAEGITEELKASGQMAWVQSMNSIRSRAQEIVMKELICE